MGADTMSIEIRTRSKFFILDGLGLHFGTRKWKASWNKADGRIWNRAPQARGQGFCVKSDSEGQ
ncbi:hypothetical protein AA309_07435 [Microvirga vignae]|uniref:Uncharacterized protein n=1 Tax=Microvirga vignae TaxID=1225564 RepID=A0A0H1REQ7_9HYPH|nr:hypothetical protein AA309_07435 [Microvirga vignae]